MTNLRQAAQQALEALENEMYVSKYSHIVEAITALRAALAEPAATPQQQSDPLIAEQRRDIVATALRGHASTRDAIQWAIEAVERHHGIKE